MKLAISNLAWDEKEDNKVIKLLHKYKIQSIEVACSKVSKDFEKYKEFWSKKVVRSL